MNIKLSYILPVVAMLGACAPDIGSNSYSYSSVGQASGAFPCTVVSVRPVNVKSSGGTGTVLGGIAGGAAGSTIGHGHSSSVLGTIGGAAVGALAGSMAENAIMTQGGYEYIVRTNDGRVYSVTQGTDTLLTSGQKCMLINGNPSRIVPAY